MAFALERRPCTHALPVQLKRKPNTWAVLTCRCGALKGEAIAAMGAPAALVRL